MCFGKHDKAEKTFNIFWYTHHLFLVYMVVLAFHGYAAWLRQPLAYVYVIPSLTIYLIERLFRGCVWRWKERDESVGEWLGEFFSRKAKPIVYAKQHVEGKALELHISKPDKLLYKAGQYCFINCPAISRFEWHPFTLTSAPNEDCLKFHIAAVGDWTTALYDKFPDGWMKDHHQDPAFQEARECLRNAAESNLSQTTVDEVKVKMRQLEKRYNYTSLKMYVDGPHGAPAQEFTKYKVAILVGAGIGVTPFAAVLRDLLHLTNTWTKHRKNPLKGLQELGRGNAAFPMDFNLEKVQFHWSTRTRESLGWFKTLMQEILEQDEQNMLECHNYLTSAKLGTGGELFNLAREKVQEKTGTDTVAGLSFSQAHAKQVETHLSRPNFDKVFKDTAELYPGEKIGVFFCGPPVIRGMLDKLCFKYNQKKNNPHGSRFKLHAENF